MYLHTKYGTATINNIGDLLCVQFFQDRTPEISERHSMTPTYIHKYNMRHALNSYFSTSGIVADQSPTSLRSVAACSALVLQLVGNRSATDLQSVDD